MKTTHSVRNLSTSAALVAAGLAASHAAAPKSVFPTPSGRIVYKIQGAGAGTSELVWQDGGKKFRQDTRLKMAQPGQQGQPQTMHIWAFADGKSLYVHQPAMGKKVLQRPMPKDAFVIGPGGLPLGARGQETGKVVGKGTVAGKPCQVRQVRNMKIWTWNGLPLKLATVAPKDAPGGGSLLAAGLSAEATKVEATGKVSASQLKVPAGYTVQKSPEGAKSSAP